MSNNLLNTKENKFYYIKFDCDDYILESCANHHSLMLQISKLTKDTSTNLVAYCLSGVSVQLLVKTNAKIDILTLIKNISTQYNKNAVVSEILGLNELLNISKLIHTTPNDWLDYPHSSLRAYLYDDVPEFLDKTHISKLYGSAVEYFEFLKV